MKVWSDWLILRSILCLHLWPEMHWKWVSLCSALFFLVHDSGYFSRYIDFAVTHLQSKQILIFTTNYFGYFEFQIILVWYYDKVEWDPGGMRNKLSLSFTLSSPLGNKWLNFLSVQLPLAWMKGSGKTDQDFKVGISNEDRRMNTDSEQSGSSPAGTGEARLLFFCIFLL